MNLHNLFENRDQGSFQIGDPVVITGNVQFKGKTGDVREIGRDGAFVVVDLYNYGPHSFHASDVSLNDYADSDDEAEYQQGVAEGKFRSKDIEEYNPDDDKLNDLKSKYLPDWEMLDHRTLQAKFVAKDHRHALEFVKFINRLSEKMDHFAEVTQDVAEVTVKTSTFDIKGLTILDFQLALYVDNYAEKNDIEQVRMQGNFGMHEGKKDAHDMMSALSRLSGQTPTSEDMAEGLGKSIKRGMAGWGAFDKDKPADVVKRVKGQDTDTLKGLSRTGPTGRGSPAELQQKAISRELKKRGEQGVAEGSKEDFENWKKTVAPKAAQSAIQNAVKVRAQKQAMAKSITQNDINRALAQKGVLEAEKNPHTSALGRALYRDLSREKKASPAQVQRNKERWAQRQKDREQGVAEDIEDTRRQVNLKKKIDKGTATPEQKKEYEALKAKNTGKKPGVAEASDISGLIAAASMVQDYIITAEVDGQTKRFRVRGMTGPGAARERFLKHASQARVIDVKPAAEKNVAEKAMIVPDNNAASAKKLYQYVARNIQDLASNASFEIERFNRPYHENKFDRFFKDSNGNPVKVLFDLGGKIEFENGALYIPVGMYYQYGGLLNGSTFVSNILNALENQSVSEAEKNNEQPWVDAKLKRKMDYAFGHYAGYRDKPEAFFKWVMNSLEHSEENDQQHDQRFDRIEQEIDQLSQRLKQVNEQHGAAVADRFSQQLAERFAADRPTADPARQLFAESRSQKRAAIREIFANQG